MSDTLRLLDAAVTGDRQAAATLLSQVYDELRKLAGSQLNRESPGQTLQPTDLVHEAYLRLIGPGDRPQWDSLGHFFAAAATAMRRILVEAARRKNRIKHGGEHRRIELNEAVGIEPGEDFLDLDDAITRLAMEDPVAGQVVELRYFAGLTNEEIAESLGITLYLVHQKWKYSRAWLQVALSS
ncbi:MAG: ECF-type sigma factor [Gemmatales bacterium]